MKHFVVISFLVFLAALIYGARNSFWRVNDPVPVFTVKNGIAEVEPGFFESVVVGPFREKFANALLTQAVFVDPQQDCPELLFQAEQWVSPWLEWQQDTYNLVLFVPGHVDEGFARDFGGEFGIPEQNMVFFDETGPLSILRERGPLRVLYSLENGIVYSELGMDRRLNQVLENALRFEEI